MNKKQLTKKTMIAFVARYLLGAVSLHFSWWMAISLALPMINELAHGYMVMSRQVATLQCGTFCPV